MTLFGADDPDRRLHKTRGRSKSPSQNGSGMIDGSASYLPRERGSTPRQPRPRPRRHGSPLVGLESVHFGLSEMDLSGHHSNPSAPLEALLGGPSRDSDARCEQGRTCATGGPGWALGAAHPRQGRIIDAISQVLADERGPMRARDVHARVETLRGEPVRWASLKAKLAGNVRGPAPRFVRVARGRYSASPSRTRV
jgi:hypothetical protein